MNYSIGIGFCILTPLVSYQLYKYFYKKDADCEKFTNNNFSKKGIEYINNIKSKPKGRKKVQFSNIVEEFYLEDDK